MKIKIFNMLFSIKFIRESVFNESNLEEFKRKPDLRIIVGVILIVLSYIIGWPLISVLGFLAYYFNEKFLIILGGPAVYGFSHLVFMLGMYLAGAKYSVIFLRWFVYRGVMVFLKNDPEFIDIQKHKYMWHMKQVAD